ncbi:phosphoethanolamine transferase [Rhizobium sp. SG2393]|uniref:phosphoethanolamine transferase n=1 Tax=Rhizobium sp. SG2393 TaxID=3276279 RepID=UPI00366A6358
MYSPTMAGRTTSGFRPRIASIPLSILVALYLLFVTNHTYWSKAWSYMADQTLAVIVLGIGMAGLFSAACIAVSVKYLTKPIFIFLILASAAAAWFMDHLGIIVDTEMIRNAAETNTAEAGHLITPAFVLHMLIFGIVPALLVAIVRIEHRTFGRKVLHNLLAIAACLGLAGAAAYQYSYMYASLIRIHRDWFETLNPVTPIASAVKFAIGKGSEANIVVKPIGTDAKVLGAAVPARKPRLVVIVAGETARAENWSMSGYSRETTPELKKQDITYFPNATSCGTSTAVSIPCLFSVYTRSEYTHRKGIETENLVDVLRHAGVNVNWWDNNTGSYKVAARIEEISFPAMNDPAFCKDGECQDGMFLKEIDKWIGTITQDTVLVVHQIGSHGPSYYLRYPEEFRRFKPDCRSAEFADCTHEELVNAYDNTLLYTDHIISSIIDRLKAVQDRFDPALIYASDHGESLGEYGVYLHGAPYMIAPSQQTHVPFLLWFGDAEKKQMDMACIAKEAAGDISHDNIFHTVLGMMHVETTVRDKDLDLVTGCRTGANS